MIRIVYIFFFSCQISPIVTRILISPFKPIFCQCQSSSQKIAKQLIKCFISFFRLHLNSSITRKDQPLVVFGIPTVYRDKDSYLSQTVKSLIWHLSKSEKSETLFVILVAEIIEEKAEKIFFKINQTFSQEIQNGLIEVIQIDPKFYPTISTASKTQVSSGNFDSSHICIKTFITDNSL